MRKPVALEHASRLINHGPTVLVSSEWEGRRNVMAVAWSMPVEFEPPRLAIVIDKRTLTRELVAASGRLAVNLPCRRNADLAYTVGSCSGRDFAGRGSDKFAAFGIQSFAGPSLGLPLVDGCVAWMECVVLPTPETEHAYDTFFVEVVSALADDAVFRDGRGQFDGGNTEMHTLHHLGGGAFALPSRTLQARELARGG